MLIQKDQLTLRNAFLGQLERNKCTSHMLRAYISMDLSSRGGHHSLHKIGTKCSYCLEDLAAEIMANSNLVICSNYSQKRTCLALQSANRGSQEALHAAAHNSERKIYVLDPAPVPMQLHLQHHIVTWQQKIK